MAKLRVQKHILVFGLHYRPILAVLYLHSLKLDCNYFYRDTKVCDLWKELICAVVRGTICPKLLRIFLDNSPLLKSLSDLDVANLFENKNEVLPLYLHLI